MACRVLYPLLLSFVLDLCTGSPYLLLANRKDIRLVDAEARRKNSSVVVMAHLADAAALDFYYNKEMLFWADVGLEEIRSAYIHDPNSNKSIITTGLITPDGIACDWVAKKLYWIDSETNRIEVSNFDGSYRKVLFWKDLDLPRALALVPIDGYGFMLWADWGEAPKIEKASMDGKEGSRKVIINKDIVWPNGIAVEYGTKRIYWADAKLCIISSMDFDGNDRKIVASGDLPHPFAITLHNEMLYWTDWTTRAVHSCNKDRGCIKRTTFGGFLSPMGIHVYHRDRQPPGETICAVENGGCSHLCLLSMYEPFYSCACPTGIRMKDDGKNCESGAKELLLLVRRSDIRTISLDTPDYTDVVLELGGIKHAIAVDYDPVENYIYWTDDEAHAIRRAFLNGTGVEDLIITEVHHPDGIAVDWIARNIYWTDTGTDRIEVSRLNGSSRKILINENLDEPRAIVLDPEYGFMYWTDWGVSPKIERAALDGSMRSVIINSSLGWPNGIAIDYETRKLYWGDAKTDKIEMSNLDGSNRREVVSGQLPHIFGFSLLGPHVYWTDWQRRSIERVDKVTGVKREIIVDQLPDLMGLKAVKVNYVQGSNLCAISNGNCSHLCLNRPGNDYICSCPVGMELSTDNMTCVVPEAFLLFSRKDNIRRISLESFRDDIIPVSGVQEANALDYDLNDFRIYWTDTSLKTINRAFMNGSSVEPVIQFGLSYPEGMAVDWVAKNLYWTDMGSNRIEVSRLDGSSRKVLLWKHLDDPRSLALDPSEGYIYWSDWGTRSRIERAAMDGSYRKVLINKLGRPNSLSIDYAEKRLYWIDMNALKIESSDFSGNNRVQIITKNLYDPYGLTQYEDYIYWTDWKTHSVERANKTSGENRALIKKNLDHVMDILVFHTSRQSGWNPCAVNNGGCDHLCLSLPPSIQHKSYTHSCACPTHHDLARDNKTCSPPTQFLLFSQRNKISRILVNSVDSPDMTIPIHGLKNIKALDYDPIEQFIYWIDGRTKSIKRSLENGTKVIVVVPNPGDSIHPYDMAVDSYSRVIYWSCSQNNIINVTGLSGHPIGTVVGHDDDKPRFIAVHPLKGLLFWTNMVHPPQIEMSSLDGQKRRVLFMNDMEHPVSLTVDMTDDLLFWADLGAAKKIESAEITGKNRKVILSSNILHPVALTVLGKSLFWIDQDQQTIEKVDKITGKDRQPVQGRMSLLTDLVAVSVISREDYHNHPCSSKNGGCSHICLIEKEKKRCSCPIDLVLATDESTCVDIPTCPADEFRCLSGAACIPNVWRCDGLAECQDMSDEMSCPDCKSHQFRCQNGDCVDKRFRCDGIPHCKDYSDEQCCEEKQFFCADAYQCINSLMLCDGKSDCNDGSDENSAHCEVIVSQKENLDKTGLTIKNIPKIVIGVVGGGVFIGIGILLAFCWKRKKPENNGIEVMMASRPLNPPGNCMDPTCARSNEGNINLPRNGSCVATSVCMSFNSSTSGQLYDRNHVTGASSSSSSATYPHATTNPPPSPVTGQSQCMYSYCCPSQTSSSVRTYRHYRSRNKPPPPTPCSTDVCDDSEPYLCRNHYYMSGVESSYDSDPFIPQPPPTPRSHDCMSDDNYDSLLSCPPSPGTEKYYYNPPPSPAPESDM